MTLLRAFLILAWLIIIAITVRAMQQLGSEGGMLFFADFAHPWRAQFNTDFSAHLLLMAAWVAYREPRAWVGALCALLTVLLGGAFSLAYVLVATFRAHGDMRTVLLGRHLRAGE